MAVKESSDELNPAVAIPAKDVAPRTRHTFSDYLALAIATCGVGYLPLAPGTIGALVGAAILLPSYRIALRLFPEPNLSAKNLSDPWKLVSGIHSSAAFRAS